MARIVVSESLSPAGLELLRTAGHDVVERIGLEPEELAAELADADALIVRSATTVDAELLAAAPRLRVVGRAGVGLDNIDLDTATARGVIVANAPTANSISAAEHTMALMLAVARNVPQAHGALTAGRWERSSWKGVELSAKTLGIVGLGRIGGLVARRARAFGMTLIGHDPFVDDERATELGVELTDLDDLIARSDFITLHLARTPDTIDLIDAARLRSAKPGLRIVNVARGGIVNEADLAAAIADGQIAGAGLDVFADEPLTGSPLFDLPQVVVTPHLGASTVEAQDRAGVTIAEQVRLALAGEFVPFAANVDATVVPEELRPFLPVAENLGARFGRLVGSAGAVDVVIAGEIGSVDCRTAELAVLKGLVSTRTEATVSYVNAERLADELGIKVDVSTSPRSPEGFVNGIRLEGDGHELAGTVLLESGEMRIISIDGITTDIALADHLVAVVNDDTPGVVGRVGTAFGDAGVNIGDMHMGRSSQRGEAMMVISTADPVPASLLEDLAALPSIRGVRVLDLPR